MKGDLMLMLGAFLLGFLSCVCVFFAGVGWQRRKAKRPFCGCSHHRCMHDENGVCHALVQMYDRGEYRTVDIECGCQKYLGPEPIPTYYHELDVVA